MKRTKFYQQWCGQIFSMTVILFSATACLSRSFSSSKQNQQVSQSFANQDWLNADPCQLTASQNMQFSSARGEKLNFPTPFHRMAWEHSCYGQTYNTPNFVDKFDLYTRYGLENGMTGNVPYWDIAKESNIELLGDSSIFQGEQTDTIRIYAHYLDSREFLKTQDGMIEFLQSKYGPPKGYLKAQMQSSIRTLFILPEDRPPFYLKFSGLRFITHMSGKNLRARAVSTSVARGKQLKQNPNLLGDTGGLLHRLQEGDEDSLDLKTTNNITYRPFHLTEHPTIKYTEKDHILAIHVVMSTEFGQSQLGQAVLGRTPEKRVSWLKDVFFPMLAKFMIDSSLKEGIHFEIHAQNIDLLIGPRGGVKHFFVKDTLDSIEDPMIKLVNGKKGDELKGTRNIGWMNELNLKLAKENAAHNVPMWYWSWFYQKSVGLFGAEKYGIQNIQKAFSDADATKLLSQELRTQFRAHLAKHKIDFNALKPGAFKKTLEGNDSVPIMELMQAMHFLTIEHALTQSNDPMAPLPQHMWKGIKDNFAAHRPNLIASHPVSFDSQDRENLLKTMEFGTWRGFKIAVKRLNGRIESWILEFPGYDLANQGEIDTQK